MAKGKYIQRGDTIDYVATGAVGYLDVVPLSNVQIGIALSDIPVGSVGALAVEGVFELPKTTPLVINQGDTIYWSTSTGKVTKTVTDIPVGYAWAAAAEAATTVKAALVKTMSLTIANSNLVTSGLIGYTTGAGGAVTQSTSKSTGVTLNKACGTITMNNEALAAGATVQFTVTDDKVAATDVICVNHTSGGTLGAYLITPNSPAAGSFKINVTNISASSLSEAIVLRFAVIKAVVS